MCEGQIVTISVLGLAIFTSLLIGFFSDNFEYKPLTLMLGLFPLTVLLMITVLVTIEMNLLREKLENQCPQYERVENVYRLKE